MYFIPFHKDVAITLLFLYKKKVQKNSVIFKTTFSSLFLIFYSSYVMPGPNMHQSNTALHPLHTQPHVRFINA